MRFLSRLVAARVAGALSKWAQRASDNLWNIHDKAQAAAVKAAEKEYNLKVAAAEQRVKDVQWHAQHVNQLLNEAKGAAKVVREGRFDFLDDAAARIYA